MATIKVTSPTFAAHQIQAEEGASLLRTLIDNGYVVPHLCHHEAVSSYGACRLCLVEVEKRGKRKLTTACNYPVADGIRVFLDTDKVVSSRQMVLELTLANSPTPPALRRLAAEHGVALSDVSFPRDDDNTCILCGLCTRVCEKVCGGAITTLGRGDQKRVGTPGDLPSELCIGCASCAYVCPTGHIQVQETKMLRTIWQREFRKLACTACGKTTITEAQRDYLVQHRGYLPDYFELCDECKRATVVTNFAGVGR